MSPFSVEVSTVGAAQLVTCRGALDLATSPALEEELQRVPLEPQELLLVDLREVDFMDSTGIGTLLTAYTRAREADARFALVQGPEQVRRVLELSGAGGRFAIVETPEQAIEQP